MEVEVEEASQVLATPDPSRQISLEGEVGVDPMQEEQTWPTAEELDQADGTAPDSRSVGRGSCNCTPVSLECTEPLTPVRRTACLRKLQTPCEDLKLFYSLTVNISHLANSGEESITPSGSYSCRWQSEMCASSHTLRLVFIQHCKHGRPCKHCSTWGQSKFPLFKPGIDI